MPTDIVQSSLPRPPEGPARSKAVSTGPSKADGRAPSVRDQPLRFILEELKGSHHKQGNCKWFADLAEKLHHHSLIPTNDTADVPWICGLQGGEVAWSKRQGDVLLAAVEEVVNSVRRVTSSPLWWQKIGQIPYA